MTGTKPVGRRWTRAEEEQLRDMLDAGMTAAEVATKLERIAKRSMPDCCMRRVQFRSKKRPEQSGPF
jgi:hypothetical protein